MTDTISAPVVASAPPTTTDATAVVLHYSLARFLVDFATPTGTSWRTEIAKLIADPIEYDTLLTLASQFQEQGRFIEPVRVDFDAAVIQNGMHRTATAVLSGHSTIAISQQSACSHQSMEKTCDVDSKYSRDRTAHLRFQFPQPVGTDRVLPCNPWLGNALIQLGKHLIRVQLDEPWGERSWRAS